MSQQEKVKLRSNFAQIRQNLLYLLSPVILAVLAVSVVAIVAGIVHTVNGDFIFACCIGK